MAPDTATANAAMLDVRKQQVNTMQRSVSPVSARGTEYREERVTPRSPAGSVYSAQRAMSPGRTRFECDYDSNPTELYLAIQRKDWRGAEAVLPHGQRIITKPFLKRQSSTAEKGEKRELLKILLEILMSEL